MTNLMTKTREFLGAYEVVKERLDNAITLTAVENMTAEEFKLLQGSFKLMDTACELVVKQSEALAAIDEKLDKMTALLMEWRNEAQ